MNNIFYLNVIGLINHSYCIYTYCIHTVYITEICQQQCHQVDYVNKMKEGVVMVDTVYYYIYVNDVFQGLTSSCSTA